MKQLIDFFQDNQIASILDVGTGTGDFLAVLKECCPKARISAIDPNTDSIKQAAEKYPEVAFREMSGESLVFSDNSFDMASISMALHHLSDVHRTLYEMQRVVKPGGWIIVNELFSDNLNPAQETHKFFHHFRSRIDRLNGVTHNETFKKEEILQLVRKSGIKIQLQFEFNKPENLISKPEDIEERVCKMHLMLKSVKVNIEQEEFLSTIEEFRERALKFGFQPATKLVIVGKSN